MKNKIAIASAFLAASSFSAAEIVINDVLSFEGFVDMSYSHTDIDEPAGDTDPDNAQASNSNSWAVDQVEISWLFDFEPVTAQIDLQYEGESFRTETFDGNVSEGNNDLDQVIVEQAFATYSMADGAAITAGRYASMLGFEAFEPTGLYQYSTAYTFFDNNKIETPGYAQGVKYTKESENTFFGFSVQDSISDEYDDNFGGPDGGWGVEGAGAYTLENGLSIFAGFAFEDSDEDGSAYVLNGYVTYETGAWIFAAELNFGETDSDTVGEDVDGVAGLLMANYAYSDKASITGRVSFYDQDDEAEAGEEEGVAFTLAHGYAFTDNLFVVTEVSVAEESAATGADTETLFGAVELLFTF